MELQRYVVLAGKRRYLSLQESIALTRLNFLKNLNQALSAYCHGRIDRKELNRRHRELRAERAGRM